MQCTICNPYLIITHFTLVTQTAYYQHLLTCCMGEDAYWIAQRFTNEPMKHVGMQFESFCLGNFLLDVA
jgi:hypothetical protein